MRKVPRDKSQEDNLGLAVGAIIALVAVFSLGVPFWVCALLFVGFLYLGGRN